MSGTGKAFGWVPCRRDDSADRWHFEAYDTAVDLERPPTQGTYELIGPKVQGDPEGVVHHVLAAHGGITVPAAPRTYAGLRSWLVDYGGEGLVWHHPDGRMAKIKRRDFGLPWPQL